MSVYEDQDRKFYPGDTMVFKCIYDTSDRPNPTTGGLSTQEEMCIAWI